MAVKETYCCFTSAGAGLERRAMHTVQDVRVLFSLLELRIVSSSGCPLLLGLVLHGDNSQLSRAAGRKACRLLIKAGLPRKKERQAHLELHMLRLIHDCAVEGYQGMEAQCRVYL